MTTSNLRRIFVESSSNPCRIPRCSLQKLRPVSNSASPGRTGLEPSLSRVRRPCASPLGNLTTGTHLAGQLSSCLTIQEKDRHIPTPTIGVRWGISRHPPMAKVPGEPPATKKHPSQSRIPSVLGTMAFPQTNSHQRIPLGKQCHYHSPIPTMISGGLEHPASLAERTP